MQETLIDLLGRAGRECKSETGYCLTAVRFRIRRTFTELSLKPARMVSLEEQMEGGFDAPDPNPTPEDYLAAETLTPELAVLARGALSGEVDLEDHRHYVGLNELRLALGGTPVDMDKEMKKRFTAARVAALREIRADRGTCLNCGRGIPSMLRYCSVKCEMVHKGDKRAKSARH